MRSRARRVLARLVIGCAMALTGATASAQDGAVRSHALGRFTFEGGATLDNAHVTYVTWGTLNAARDNAVLLPSWYGGRAVSYQFLVGPDRALDPAKYFVVATEMFGSGGSSSPSNTPPPFDGPRFPAVAIRDDVEAARRVLRSLGVERLRAVIGFSMGAQQAFQWATSYPAEVDAIVALCGTAKTYGHGRVRLESAISALTADPRWKGGDYTEPPADGIRAWAQHWSAWVYSQEWWRREMFRPQSASVEAVLEGSVRNWTTTGTSTTRCSWRAPGRITTSARPRGSTATSSTRWPPFAPGSSTCLAPPISISRSRTRSTSGSSSPASPSCPFPRCGATPRAAAGIRPTRPSSTARSRRFCRRACGNIRP